MIEWQYVTIALFALAIGGVVGWYVAKRRKVADADHQSLFVRAVSAFLVLLAIGSTLQIFWFQREQDAQAKKLGEVTECQYRVNQALIAVLTTRQGASTSSDQALIQMATDILNAESPADSRQTIQTFIFEMKRLQTTRKNNPYPTIPNDCRP